MKQQKHSMGGGLPRTNLKRRRSPRKPRLALFGLVACALALVGTIAALMSIPSTVLAAGQTIADESTSGDWNGEFTSENVGKVWTDKSVSTDSITVADGTEDGQTVTKEEGSDFLVGLSALSSTSNLMSSSNKPLDIVLVLDVSGSMAADISTSGTYSPTTIVRDGGDYYIEDGNGGYEKAVWVSGQYEGPWWNPQWVSAHWEDQQGHTIYPITQNESGDGRVQFYTYESTSTTKLDALQTAVNSFIDSTNTINAGISDQSLQHRIALVKFADDTYRYAIGDDFNGSYNYTQVVSDFTTNSSALKSAVDGLEAAGCTAADYGFTMAQNVLSGGNYSGNGGGNRGAYTGARDNAQKVIIFFTDGEPNHQNGFDYSVANDTINLANSIKNSENSKLKGTLIYSIGVFSDAEPSDTTGDFNRYMHAVSSNYPSASCADDSRSNPANFGDDYVLTLGNRAQTSEGADSQYYFAATNSAQLNDVFSQIAADIQETGVSSPTAVTEGQESSSGYITFTDTLGDYMSVGDTFTIVYNRTQYTVEKNADGEYVIPSTKVAGNGVYDSANLQDIKITVTPGTGSAGDTIKVEIPATLIPCNVYDIETVNGETTVEESPALPINVFYSVSLRDDVNLANPDETLQAYISSNTNEGGTVSFYANSYSGTTANVTASFTPAEGNSYYHDENGDVAASGTTDKTGENPIGVNYVVSASAAEGVVTHRLGNNGKLSVELPGTLAVTKSASVAQGFDGPSNIDDVSFNFTLTLGGAPEGTTSYVGKVMKNGVQQGDDLTINASGANTFTLKNGETLYVYGLTKDMTYTVSEGTMPEGFTQTSPVTGEGDQQQPADAKGTIKAGETSTASFTNEYSASSTTLNDEGVTLYAKKTLDGRNWRNGDSFTFQLTGDGISTPMTVTATSADAVAFGDIEYTKPGTYTYTITEVTPESPIAGITYSDASYQVTVVVSDNGKGELVIGENGVTITQLADDKGDEIADQLVVDGTTVVFTNTYDVDSVGVSVGGLKSYTDNSGGNPITNGKFSFTLNAVTTGAPMPDGANGNKLTVGNTGESFSFGSISFDGDDVGKTYEYTIGEVQGTEVNMTYDKTEYTLKIAVSEDTDENGVTTIVATPTYSTPAGTVTSVSFSNSYTPDSVTLTGETALHGVKNLTGRAMTADDKFYFTLTAVNDDAMGVLKNSETVTATFSEENSNATFSFGDLTFNEVGEYTFSIDETNADGGNTTNANGITYDTHVTEVTVNVTLNKETGDLEAAVTYKNAESTADTSKAVFNNTYTPATVVVGDDEADLGATKVVSGAKAPSEFDFQLTLTSDNASNVKVVNDGGTQSDWVTATANTSGLSDATGSESVSFGDIAFTAEGTYEFVVDETTTADNSNWTYDASTKTITVTVTDNLSGQLVAKVTGNNPTFYNTYYNIDDAKDVENSSGSSIDGQMVGVGDELTYTIDWVNNAVDKNGTPINADIVITDTIPTGTELVEGSISDDGVLDGDTITWTFKNQEPGASDTVSFTVKVTEAALGTSVENSAKVQIGENNPSTNTVTNPVPGKTAADSEDNNLTDGSDIQLGDVLTFTIAWANESGSDAQVTITDELPNSLTYVAGTADPSTGFSANGQTLTWNLGTQANGTSSTVTFQARVNENAISTGVDNTAKVEVGNDEHYTNTTPDLKVNTAQLTVTKTVKAENGATVDTNKSFSFTIKLTDSQGNALAGSYSAQIYSGDQAVGEELSLSNNSTFQLKHGQSLVVSGLPEGAKYEVTETLDQTGDAGYAQSSNNASGTIASGGATAAFTNTYTPGSVAFDPDGKHAPAVTKEVVGNGASDQMSPAGYKFTIAVSNVTDPDNPTNNGVTISNPNGTSNARGKVAFHDITFSEVGTYEITISEVPGTNDHVTYDSHSLVYQVKVTDAGGGKLAVALDESTVSEGEATFTNVYYDKDDAKASAPAEGDTNGLQVGDTLTYTIDWASNAVDKDGEPTSAKIVVTDKIPAGTEVIESSLNGGTVSDGVITWNLGEKAYGQAGTITFQVRLTEDAVQTGTVKNQATVNVGNNSYKTNETIDLVGTGNLTISKEIVLTAGQGTEIDTSKYFTFTVNITDAADKPLTGTYNCVVAAGEAPAQIQFKNGEAAISLKHGQSYIIQGLPEGARVKVTESKAAGYTPDAETKDATVSKDGASIKFTNTYSATAATGVPTSFSLTKTFTGHEWTQGYSFQFELAPHNDTPNAPMPQTDETAGVVYDEDSNTATVTVSGPVEASEGVASKTFNFGSISYSAAGTYKYTVTEVVPDSMDAAYNAGISYAKNTATITVTVSDNLDGTLSASATVSNGTFTNTYDTGTVDIDSAANGGLVIIKNMTGRDIAKDDFTFTMTGNDPTSIARLNGGKALTFSTNGANLGNAEDSNSASETVRAITGLTFTKADAGKTYTYTIAETIPKGAVDNGNDTYTLNGVTYDAKEHTIAFEVIDGGKGTLTVKAYVDGATEPTKTYTGVPTSREAVAPITFTFDNSYDAGSVTVGGNDADVTLLGEKKLANRPMVEGEFTFNVTDAKGNLVISGTNDADGTITFGTVTYTTEKLNGDVANGIARRTPGKGKAATYTYQYTVDEDQTSFAVNGITAVTGSLQITVTVVDDGAGNLSASVTYPNNGASMVFENIYGNGENGSFTSNLSGSKVLAVESGNNAPDITGKYTFTVTVPEGAPAPERTTASNDANGNVDFGKIVFTMENVFGDTGDEVSQPEDGVATMSAQRTKTFTYTVTETGSVDGVNNDATASYDVTFTVTDNGDGTLSVTKSVSEGPDFTFTNTYSVDPTDSSLTGDGGFSVTKKLTSTNTDRALAEGEFTFQLLDGNNSVVAEATNNAQGVVSLPALTFDTPGTYSYTLVEVDDGAAGVTYDGTRYAVSATVKDNSNGTLSVTWSMPQAQDGAVTFENTYTADPTSVSLGATKTLTGRAMNEGEFTFELVDANGKVLQTVTNDANGGMAFDSLVFDAEGTYKYTIREQLPEDDDPDLDGVQKKGVTYDQTEWTATITVTDNTKTGCLEATVDFGDGVKVPNFTNTYAPTDPATIVFGATKTLTGRDITAGEFTFELLDSSGAVVQTAKVAADGSVVFSDPVAFGSAGTYVYTIREQLPADDDAKTDGIQSNNVTYDETVHTATVTVTDNLDGTLSATVSYDGSGELPNFENCYVEPPKMPATGDVTNTVLPVVLAAGGVALAAGAIVLRRRRSR